MEHAKTPHTARGDVVKRLRRAHGHLGNVVTMLEDQCPCHDVAQQLHAVERAVGAAKKLLIHDHIDHCLEQSVVSGARGMSRAIDDFKTISKYL